MATAKMFVVARSTDYFITTFGNWCIVQSFICVCMTIDKNIT